MSNQIDHFLLCLYVYLVCYGMLLITQLGVTQDEVSVRVLYRLLPCPSFCVQSIHSQFFYPVPVDPLFAFTWRRRRASPQCHP